VRQEARDWGRVSTALTGTDQGTVILSQGSDHHELITFHQASTLKGSTMPHYHIGDQTSSM
jgi:hypothetical protein